MTKIEKNKVFAKKDKRLLESAKSIFGEDIVIEAWLIGVYFNNDNHEYQSYLLNEIKEKKAVCCENEIDIGCENIALKFSSGNIVRFSSSEWGDISKNTDEFIEVELPTITIKKMADFIKGD